MKRITPEPQTPAANREPVAPQLQEPAGAGEASAVPAPTAARGKLKPEQKSIIRHVVSHVILISLLVLVLVPYIMVVSASFRRGNYAPSGLFPDKVSLEHWKYVLGIPYQEIANPATGETHVVQAETPPLLWFWNSIKVSSIASAAIILLSGTAAYAFARLKFKFKSVTLSSLLILQMFPMVLALVAIYSILDFLGQYVRWLGLNTQPGLILVYLGGISGYIWMIKGYFETIPESMEESARIDGASQFQTFMRILLPMSLPIFAVVFILSFIAFMSEYPVASIVLQARSNWTLAVGANSFLAEHEKLWGRFSALAVLSGLPITVMFLLCQKFIVGGLTSGGAKE
ncbi:MAG: maltose ABC transporter permease MalG [Verrucomicrobia bacterium]|nr:maltose ABC transporter permease MalG [Verrucomicrobiota bacterium]